VAGDRVSLALLVNQSDRFALFSSQHVANHVSLALLVSQSLQFTPAVAVASGPATPLPSGRAG
jgi:hypothetical protein